VEFRHLLLQEFFAGRGIPSKDFLNTIISNEWWQRAIVFYFGENPSDSKSLEYIKDSLATRPIKEVYHAALTMGLALQACYLIQVKDKLNIFRWVIDSLSNVLDQQQRFPLKNFLFYYLFGRDAVALSIIEQNIDEIFGSWSESGLNEDEKDIRTFWVIIGLLESGCIETAEKIVKGFRPSDPKLLFGIHLGCFLIQHLRVSRREQRQIAERISHSLQERVKHLRVQLLNEMKTELLEVRKGEVKAIESPKTEDEKTL
jgi:hypothetical protein